MGSTIGPKNSSAPSVQTPAISSAGEPKHAATTTPVKQESSSPNQEAIQSGAKQQAKETASLQDLSGKMRNQELSSKLGHYLPRAEPLVNHRNVMELKKQLTKLLHDMEGQEKKVKDLENKLSKTTGPKRKAIEHDLNIGKEKLKHTAANVKSLGGALFQWEEEHRLENIHQDTSRQAIRNMR